MLIYISVNIRGSVFSGSEAQTVLQLAYALSSPQGGSHTVKLLNINPSQQTQKQEWYDDCKSLQQKWEQVTLDNNHSEKQKADLLIDVAGLKADQRSQVTKQSVLFVRNHYLYQLESSIYPANQSIQDISGLSAIWTWETDTDTIEILKCIGVSCSVVVIPYLWNPFIVQAYFDETRGVHKFPASIPSTWNIRIAENNTSNTSNCTFPLIALKSILDSSAISCDSIIVYNSEHLRDNKFFQENIIKNAAGHVDKAPIRILEGRMRILDTILVPRTIFFSHIRFRTMRWMLFECAWTGIPVVHNSLYLKSIGCGLERCYYSDNSIVEACDAFKKIVDDSLTLNGIFSENSLKEIRIKILTNYSNSLTVLSTAVRDVSLPVRDVSPPPSIITKTSLKVYTIAFHDMWADFQPSYNFFTLLLESTAPPNTKIIGKWSHECTDSPSLVIMGPYGNGVPPFNDIPTVFHTSECLEAYPQHEDIKLKLGFTSNADDEIRLPHWMISINWFGADVDKLVNPRTIPPEWATTNQSTQGREKFAAFIVSNPSNPIRNKAFIDLCKYKQVDSAGRVMNTIGDELFAGLGGGGGELRKIEFMRQYRYAIVYENQTAPGYVTEKLLHAKAAGCVPIYWGDKAALKDFNSEGFLYIDENSNIIEKVKFVEEQPAVWKNIAAIPALTADSFQAAKDAVANTADSIWKLLTVAAAVTASTDVTAKQIAEISKTAETAKTESKHLTENTPITFATGASNKFIPSLHIWLTSVLKHVTTFNNYNIIVYLGADISDELVDTLKEKYIQVKFIKVESTTISTDFPDYWDYSNYAWKLWIWNDLIEREKGRIVLFTDAGVFIVRIPTQALNAALENGVMLYEDFTQLNKYWSSESFCKNLQVTAEELEKPQTASGLIMFDTASQKAQQLFKEAFELSKVRSNIVGPKWASILPNGQPTGHHHDQSVLSILAIRYNVARRNLYLDYNHNSLRDTFRSGASFYVHRGNFIPNKDFIFTATTTKKTSILDAWVINLERRKDRYDHFMNQEDVEAVKRWDAIDGKKMQLTQDIIKVFENNTFNWKKGVLGCSISHLGLWYELSKEGAPDSSAYLIFEDDAVMPAGWKQAVEDAFSVAPPDFDVLYLGGILPPNKSIYELVKEPIEESQSIWSRIKPNNYFGQIEKTPYFHFCAYSYILSKKGAKKLMNIISQVGYYTVSDHMLCNVNNDMVIYSLTELLIGCIQENDPVYVKADFNNYDRKDTFDSDLWNNTDIWSVEELSAIGCASERNVGKALELLRHAEAVSSSTKVVKQQSIIPTINKIIIYAKKDITPESCMEHNWLQELLDSDKKKQIEYKDINEINFIQNEQPPIILVQRPVEDYSHILLGANKFVAIHISDEYETNNISWYNNPNCIAIIRTYSRIECKDNKKVITIPLGYCVTNSFYKNEIVRPYSWGFCGTGWYNRKEKLDQLTEKTPMYILSDKWEGVSEVEKYIKLLSCVKCMPCPRGQNYETFRLYECLESGVVPIYVRERGDGEYWKTLTGWLPLKELKTWSDANIFIQQLHQIDDFRELYLKKLIDAWKNYKNILKNIIKDLKIV